MNTASLFWITALIWAGLVLVGHKAVLGAEIDKSPAQLRELATHIVTGEVLGVDVRSAHSETEPGGFDYMIHCTIAVDAVEKGTGVTPGDSIVVRCFQPKARLAITAGLQGHHPIPAVGQLIRAHFRGQTEYHVLHPNGLTSVDGNPLQEANEVKRLFRSFTLLLPLQLWILIGVLVVPVAVLTLFFNRPVLNRVLTLLLLIPAILWTGGLSVGLLHVMATLNELQIPVTILGILVIVPHGAFAVWLCLRVLQPGNIPGRTGSTMAETAS